MPIGQNLMALFGADFPRDSFAGVASGGSKGAGSGAAAAFSAILAEQTPEDLDALMQRLAEVTSDVDATLPLPSLIAADGKELPGSMQGWFQQLAQVMGSVDGDRAEGVTPGEGEDVAGLDADDPDSILAGISQQWQQWLARLPSDGEPSAEEGGDESLTADSNPAVAALAAIDAAAKAAAAEAGADDVLASGGGRGTTVADLAAQLRAILRGEAQANATADGQATARDGSAKSADAAVAQVDANQRQTQADVQQQRAMQSGATEQQPVPVGKLIEQLESRLAARASSLDSNAIDDGKGAAAAQVQSNGQVAMTARPVTGATQTLGVPMGQSGWSEAVVNKVMWMSSQNVKSVEIQLDPAELGPLEIKIQTRGQEHQVQFVSQHAGVRDALEGQMHRLRDMFTQQGASLVDVNVSDGSAEGRQSQGSFAGLADQGGGRGDGGNTPGRMDGSDDALASDPAAVLQTRLTAARLVDYYA
jgi:flagellar hook-length control protein FliK